VRVALARPLTFMNRSGDAVLRLLQERRLQPGDILVVYDDVHLPVGTIRIRARGSAGGHNGMKSILAALGTEEFPRLRIGIGAPPEGPDGLADYVLAPFLPEERGVIQEAVEVAAAAARLW